METNSGLGPADIASLVKNDDGSNCWWVIILFLIICCGWGGNGWGNGNANNTLDATLAASAAQGGYVTNSAMNDALRLQSIQQGQRDIIDANAASEQRLTATLANLAQGQANNTMTLQQCCSEIQANCTANSQRVLDQLQQNRIEQLQQQNAMLSQQLQTSQYMGALQQATANVVRYPTQFAYATANPFCTCDCKTTTTTADA